MLLGNQTRLFQSDPVLLAFVKPGVVLGWRRPRWGLLAPVDAASQAGPEQFGFTSVIHLAETEAQAWADLQPHLDYFRQRCFALPMPMFCPPGYTTGQSYRTRIEIARANASAGGPSLFSGTPLVGTPEQVGEWLMASMEEAGAGIFMANFQIGDMPHESHALHAALRRPSAPPFAPTQDHRRVLSTLTLLPKQRR